MDWQLIITWLAIGCAGGFILWRGGRMLRSSRKGCNSGCGCSKVEVEPKASLIAPEQLTLRQPR
jgi:hypothetical protein